jgi:hypothetical protein
LIDLTMVHCSSGHAGSKHDSTVFLQSSVVNLLRPHLFLLGDGGYAGMPGVVSPIRDARTLQEQAYNDTLR